VRACRERSRSRAAEKGDELAPPHELLSDEATRIAHWRAAHVLARTARFGVRSALPYNIPVAVE